MNSFSKLFFNDKKNNRIVVSISTYGLDFYNNKLKTLNKMVNIAKDDFQFIDDEDIEIEARQNHLVIKFVSKQKKIPKEYLEDIEGITITDFDRLKQSQSDLLRDENSKKESSFNTIKKNINILWFTYFSDGNETLMKNIKEKLSIKKIDFLYKQDSNIEEICESVLLSNLILIDVDFLNENDFESIKSEFGNNKIYILVKHPNDSLIDFNNLLKKYPFFKYIETFKANESIKIIIEELENSKVIL